MTTSALAQTARLRVLKSLDNDYGRALQEYVTCKRLGLLHAAACMSCMFGDMAFMKAGGRLVICDPPEQT